MSISGDVQRIVRYCSEIQQSVSVWGCGTSSEGQALSNGVVIDLRSLNRVINITDDYIEVEAGIRYYSILGRQLFYSTLIRVGVAMAASVKNKKQLELQGRPNVSVGGLLSLGGITSE